jgi:hypothetical protein
MPEWSKTITGGTSHNTTLNFLKALEGSPYRDEGVRGETSIYNK